MAQNISSQADAIFEALLTVLNLMHTKHIERWKDKPYITADSSHFKWLLDLLADYKIVANPKYGNIGTKLDEFVSNTSIGTGFKVMNVSFTKNSHIRSVIEQGFLLEYWQITQTYKSNEEKKSAEVKKLQAIGQLCGLSNIYATGQPADNSKHLIGAAVDVGITSYTYAYIPTNSKQAKIVTVTDENKLKSFRDEFLKQVANNLGQLIRAPHEEHHIEIKDQTLLSNYKDAYTILYNADPQVNYTPVNFQKNVIPLLTEYYVNYYQKQIKDTAKQKEQAYKLDAIWLYIAALARSKWYLVGNASDPQIEKALALVRDPLDKLLAKFSSSGQSGQETGKTSSTQTTEPKTVEDIMKKLQEQTKNINITSDSASTVLTPTIPAGSTVEIKLVLPSFEELMSGAYELDYDEELIDTYPIIEGLWIPRISDQLLLAKLALTAYYDPFATKLARFLKELKNYFDNYAQLPTGVTFTYPELLAMLTCSFTTYNPFYFVIDKDKKIIGILPSNLSADFVLDVPHVLPGEKFAIKTDNKTEELSLPRYDEITPRNLANYVDKLTNIIKKAIEKDTIAKENLYDNYLILRSKDLSMIIVDVQLAQLKRTVLQSIKSTLNFLKVSGQMKKTEQMLSFVGALILSLAGITFPKEAQEKGPIYYRTKFNENTSGQQKTVSSVLKTLDATYTSFAKTMDQLAASLKENYTKFKQKYTAELENLKNLGDTKRNWQAWAGALNGKGSIVDDLPPELRLRFLGKKTAVLWQTMVWENIGEKGLLSQFLDYLKGKDVEVVQPISAAETTDEYSKLKQELDKLKQEIQNLPKEKENKITKNINDISSKATKDKYTEVDNSPLKGSWRIF